MDDITRLIMQVQGEAEVKRLEAEVEKAAIALESMRQKMVAAGASSAQMAAAMRPAAQNLLAFQQQLGSAQQSLAGFGGGSASKATYIVSSLAQAAQDAQYGLKNVENNVLALTSSFGPWGVAIGIGTAAAIELYTHWDAITKLWDSGGTKTEAERMKELEKATGRTVAEMKALRDYSTRESIGKGASAPTKAESEIIKDVTEALRETGPIESIAEKLAMSRIGGSFNEQNLRGQMSVDEREESNNIKSRWYAAGSEGRERAQKELLERVKNRVIQQAIRDLESVGTDPASLEAIAQQLEKAGAPEAADALRDALKKPPMGPPRPENMMAEDAKRFNATGESDTIAGPGQFLARQQKALDEWNQEQLDIEAERNDAALDKSIDRQKEGRARVNKRQAEKTKRAIADFDAMNPREAENADDFMRNMAVYGVTETFARTFRASYGKGENWGLRRRAPSLNEMRDSIFAEELKRLKAAGVPLEEAEKKAEEFARQRVEGFRSRAAENLADPNILFGPRAVGQMAASSYIESLGTAKEGYDQQMVEYQKKLVDIMIAFPGKLEQMARMAGMQP